MDLTYEVEYFHGRFDLDLRIPNNILTAIQHHNYGLLFHMARLPTALAPYAARPKGLPRVWT